MARLTHSPTAKAVSGDELRSKLRQYDRSPFHDVLATFIEQSPEAEAIKAFAERAPDKWAAALASLARIAGFTEKTEITQNVNVNIGKMSDSQLEDALRRLTHEMGLPMIDAEFTDVPEAVEETLETDETDGTNGAGEDL